MIQVARLGDGQRKVISMQEVTGMEGDIVTMQEIYAFRQTSIAPDGTVQGHFCATGIRPKFLERLRTHGLNMPDELFDPNRIYE